VEQHKVASAVAGDVIRSATKAGHYVLLIDTAERMQENSNGNIQKVLNLYYIISCRKNFGI